MIYYPRYPAHYVSKTLHLTMEQDGAYTRLLDWMYMNNCAVIPAERVFVIARASKPSEKRAVKSVLDEFFSETENGWENERVAQEILRAKPRIDSAKNNGLRGGRPKKKKPSGFPDDDGSKNPVGFSDETQTKPSAKPTQEPITNTGRKDRGRAEDPAPREHDDRALATEAALALRGVGMLDVHPSRPELLALLASGATLLQLVDTAAELRDRRGKPPALPYLAATLQGRAADMQHTATVTPLPAARVDNSAAGRAERAMHAGDARDRALAEQEALGHG